MEQLDIIWISEFPPRRGGVGDYSFRVVNELAESGHDIHVFSSTGERPKGTHNSVRISAIPRTPIGWFRVFNTQSDIISFQYPGIPQKLLSIYGIVDTSTTPSLLTMHEPPTGLQFAPFLTIFDSYGFLSKRCKDEFMSGNILVDTNCTSHVYNLPYFGIQSNIGSRAENYSTEYIDDFENTIICPGFITERKQYHLVVDALQQIISRRPRTGLIFAGGPHPDSDGSYLKQIKRRISNKSLSQNVKITGLLEEDELNQYMARGDVCVLPYKRIYQSSVLVKCIAVGGAPIVSPIPGLEEIVEEYGGKVMVGLETDMIADSILSALSNPPQIKSEKLINDMSWEKTSKKYQTIFAEMLS